MRSECSMIVAVLACCGTAAAQPVTVEAGALRHTLSEGYGRWTHQFVRGAWQGGADSWNVELVNARQFADRGTLLVLGNTHRFDERWYSSASVSGSSGGFFFPQARLDLAANRKWLAQRQLISTLGITAVNAKDGHRDRSLLLAATYYFDSPWVLEGGLRINRSNPGQVVSRASYLAATYGRHQQQILSLRYGFGAEAYHQVGAHALLVDFKSNVWTATWRRWVRPRQGFQLRAESYHNPFYDRRGVELSAFQEF